MTEINQNYSNPYLNFRQPQDSESNIQYVKLPRIYQNTASQGDEVSFKDTVKKADVMNFVSSWLEHPFLMIGSAIGMSYGIDKFSKTFQGEYDKSLPAKAARLGDRIENSDFIQNKYVQNAYIGAKKGVNYVGKFLMKNDLVKAIFTTPTKPEWGLVKDEMQTMEQRTARIFNEITSTMGLGTEGRKSGGIFSIFKKTPDVEKPIPLDKLGLAKDEITALKEKYNVTKLSKMPETASSEIILKRLGKSETEIANILSGADYWQVTKKAVLDKMGLTAADIDRISADTAGNFVGEIKTAAEKARGSVWVSDGHHGFLGEHQVLERKIGMDEVGNRLKSLSDPSRTKTGKAFAYLSQLIHRCLTWGNGKMGIIIFITPLLVETMLNTKKAEKDEKLGTAIGGAISSVSWVFTFPLALKIMHSLTGMRYAGMSKEKLEEYRALRDEIIRKNKAGEYTTEQFNDAIKQLKDMEKVEGQSLLTRFGRKLGKFATMDLELKPTNKNSNIFVKVAKGLSKFGKNIVGIPTRLLLFGLLSMGLLDGTIEKICTKLFGKSYDPFREEERKESAKEQEAFSKEDLQQRLMELQAEKDGLITDEKKQSFNGGNNLEQNQQFSQNMFSQQREDDIYSDAKQNLAERINNLNQAQDVKNNEIASNQQIENPQKELSKDEQRKLRDNYTYVPSQNNYVQSEENDLKNEANKQPKYVPSQLAAQIPQQQFDNSGMDKVLRRADMAEQRALDVLAGRFNGI